MAEKTGASQNSTLAVVSAIYLILLAIGSFCLNLGLVVGGSLLGGLSGAVQQAASESGSEIGQEATDAINQAAGAGGLITIFGIIGLVVAVAALVVAVGLFQRKPWSYMGTIGVCGALIAVWILLALFGGGIGVVQIVFIIVNAIIIFLFWTDQGTKVALGQA